MYRAKLLIALLCLVVAGIPAAVSGFSGTAQPPTPVTVPDERIDSQIWSQLFSAPNHQATFIVNLVEAPGMGFESTIDAQFRLENMLEIMRHAGTIQEYQAYYGANIIRVNGSAQAVRSLLNWPELAAISAYTPGEDWELAASESASDSPTATGRITGFVVGPDGITPLGGIKAIAYRLIPPLTWVVAGNGTTSAGVFQINNLPTAVYRLKFEDPTGNYVSEYYNNKVDFSSATNFDVADGQTTTLQNTSLDIAGKISGIVTEVGGSPVVKDIVASAWYWNSGYWVVLSSAVTNTSGVYTVGSLKPGTYRVRFSDVYNPPRYLDEWYNNKLDLNSADDVIVAASATTPGINADMGWYGRITGNVKAFDGITNLLEITVDAYQWSVTLNDWEWVSFASTDASGNYEIYGLTTQDYHLEFVDPLNQYASEYYNNKASLATGDPVHVDLGSPTANINALLDLKNDTVNNSLIPGWNLVSLNTTLTNTAPNAVFGSLSGSHQDIYAYNCADTADPWKLYNPSLPPPINDMSAVSLYFGYWVNMTYTDTLTTSGYHPISTTLNLCSGWNLIGYPSVGTRSITTVLAGIAGKYNLVYQYKASDIADPWKVYNPSAPSYANDLKNMEPGYGYWIRMTQAATLIIPGR